MSLTPKQARFVEEYLVDLNATQAAIRAGYSPKTAYSQGERLLKNVEVHRAIQEAQEARSERTGITQDEVIRGLKKEAALEGDGSSHSARVAAWAHLGKHLGIFTDNLTLSGSVGLRWEDALRELE
jgi:phage terminase small subunit